MENQAPINIKSPTIHINSWKNKSDHWLDLNIDIGGNPDLSPITIKAAYIIGIIFDSCYSVDLLLRERRYIYRTYLPAYGIFASSVELLGRCINGNAITKGSSKDLETGFKWLVSSNFSEYKNDYLNVPKKFELIRTSKYKYSISNLVALRHFTAHGLATSTTNQNNSYAFGSIDYEILMHFPNLLANGLEAYLSKLKTDECFSNELAKANVLAIRTGPLEQTWELFERDINGKYKSISEIITKFDWDLKLGS